MSHIAHHEINRIQLTCDNISYQEKNFTYSPLGASYGAGIFHLFMCCFENRIQLHRVESGVIVNMYQFNHITFFL